MSLNFGKLDFAVSFNYGTAIPADARSYFESYDAAALAASTAAAVGSSDSAYYFGMPIVVVEDSVASFYQIATDGTLKSVGSSALGDGKSITVENGTIKVVGFDEAEVGAQPRKKADGTIEWVKPDTTTVEGLENLVSGLESDVETIQGSIDTLTGTGDGSIEKTVADAVASIIADADASYDSLKEIADWILSDTTGAAKMQSDITTNTTAIEALEALVGDIDVASQIAAALEEALKSDGTSKYALASELEALQTVVDGIPDALAGKVDAIEGMGLSEENFTTALKEKLEALDENGEANVIEIIKLNGTAVDIVDKTVDIQLPAATATTLGLVKSSDEENEIAVADDGTMSVNSININKLVQTEGDTLILDGGDSGE